MKSHSKLTLNLQRRVERPIGSQVWTTLDLRQVLIPTETAILICDMWNQHWCTGATRRIHELARRIEIFTDKARAVGIQIIHAPSDTMPFYRHYPERRRILKVPPIMAPQGFDSDFPKVPIGASDYACDTPGDIPRRAWIRENLAISMGEDDVISDNGLEIYSFLRHRGIHVLLFTGVHVNECILERSFGIKQMMGWGIECVLVRDLTEAIYDPREWPYISVAQATDLSVEYVEKYWCPSTLSSELMLSPSCFPQDFP